MEVRDEINQLNEIINKLDVVQDNEWQKKEDETEEEYNGRIENIEEELEEELLDYISDSLLFEQELNEEEAIKEAQEKIEKDYEIFSDAFTKNEDGTVILKSNEELATLGYITAEEINKLKEIENNINAPEEYFRKIKENITASKDIDLEIDRKMELAKSIINAKKRGETIPNSLNPNLEKDKFERVNDYIANTNTLKRIPAIQSEYITNNYIADKRYDNITKNINNNNFSNHTKTTSINTQSSEPTITTTNKKIITKKIPERKNIIYSNFEKKLDRDNDLTKQKIKARTELKSILKKCENKDLSEKELEELNSEIENVKNKYPNAVNDKILDKLYDTFKIKFPIEKNENQSTNKTIETNSTETKTEKPSKNNKMSKAELLDLLSQVESKYNVEEMNAKGINALIISKLVSYLQDNDDSEIQKMLDKQITKLQTERPKNRNFLFIYNFEYTNPKVLYYMYENYKNGVKSVDGTRNIIPANKNAAAYYLHLTSNAIKGLNKEKNSIERRINTALKEGKTSILEQDREALKKLEDIEKKWNIDSDLKTKIEKEINSNVEENGYRFFEFLKEKHQIDKLKGIERLKVEPTYISELEQAENIKNNTEYLNLAISKELISKCRKNITKENLLNNIQEIENKRKNKREIDFNTLELLGDIYNSGIISSTNQEVVKQDKMKAREIYEQIINQKTINSASEVFAKLIDIYEDKTSPLYDKNKVSELSKIATENGLHIQRKSISPRDKEPSIYVCSDLHGEYPTYQAITKQLQKQDKLFILGDVIDRGPDGIKILQDIMKRKEQGQVEFLIGNHEFMMMQAEFFGDVSQKENWEKNNGGKVTKEAFEKLTPSEQSKLKEFLLDSYVYKNISVNSQDVHLVHAKAVQDKDDNRDKTVREMMAENKENLMSDAVWKRKSDSSIFAEPHPESAKPGMFTVIGHTPTAKNRVEYKNGYYDIDCGCGYEENASLVNLTQGTVKYFDVKIEREKDKHKER